MSPAAIDGHLAIFDDGTTLGGYGVLVTFALDCTTWRQAVKALHCGYDWCLCQKTSSGRHVTALIELASPESAAATSAHIP